ncbi:hypothetical protein ACFPRL_16400 [Pseudoclavibacter helvolus]
MRSSTETQRTQDRVQVQVHRENKQTLPESATRMGRRGVNDKSAPSGRGGGARVTSLGSASGPRDDAQCDKTGSTTERRDHRAKSDKATQALTAHKRRSVVAGPIHPPHRSDRPEPLLHL